MNTTPAFQVMNKDYNQLFLTGVLIIKKVMVIS